MKRKPMKGIPSDKLFQSQIGHGHVGEPVDKYKLDVHEHRQAKVITIPPCPVEDWAQTGRHNASTKTALHLLVAMMIYDMKLKEPIIWCVPGELYSAIKDVGRQGVPMNERLKLDVVRGPDGQYEVRTRLTIRQYLRKWAQGIGAKICRKSNT